MSEIWGTTSLFSPRRALKMGAMSSWNPYFSLYPSRISSACSFMAVSLSFVRGLGRLGVAHPVVSLRHEHVDVMRLDVIQDPLVVRDQEDPQFRSRERVHAFGDDAEGVDVESGVG